MAPIRRSLGILDDSEPLDYLSGVRALLVGERLKPIRIAWLLRAQAREIGTGSVEVLLSSYVAMKLSLKRVHPDYIPVVVPEIFDLLPRIINNGECRKIGPRKLVFLWSRRDATRQPYKAIVKATRDGRFVFLDTAYRIQPSQVARTVAESTPVRSRTRKPRMGPPFNPT